MLQVRFICINVNIYEKMHVNTYNMYIIPVKTLAFDEVFLVESSSKFILSSSIGSNDIKELIYSNT
jgi:hypothetical protein